MSRTMYIARVFALFLLIFGTGVQAEDDPIHTTAASFLKMSVGARTLAMGGTGVAGRDAPWALFVNPALLGARRESNLAFSYHRSHFEVDQMALGGTIRVGARGGLGLGVNYVRVGDVEVRSAPTDAPDAIAEASDLALCAGYGRELIRGLYVGVGGKFFQEKLYEDTASSFVLDLGARVAHELLDVGLALRNAGGEIRFGEESFSPPMMGVLGISVPLFAQRLRAAADFEQPLVEGNRQKLHVGCEARFTNLCVRAGYTHAFGGPRPDAWTGWTAGIGFLYDRWEVDYGMAPSEVLGDVHQVSMAMRSGASPLQIYITSPADGDTVHEARAHLKGFVEGEEAQAVQIKVNNETIKELHPERGIRVVWRKEVLLREGDNVLKVTAEAVGGQRATSTVKVVYTPPPRVVQAEGGPEIHVEKPEDGQVVYTEVVKVSGYASDDQGIQRIEVLVNGEKRLSKHGAGNKFFPFSKSVNLDKVHNKIQIVAYAVDGRKSTSTRTVELGEAVLRRINWALLIAVDTYRHWPTLETPVSDADTLRALLTSRYGFAPDHIVTLYNEQATRTGIIGALTDFARKLGPKDNLLIYYAGHGELHKELKMGYWVPFEAERAVAGYLENAVLHSYVAAIPAQHILMVVDACYSGALIVQRGPVISPDHDRYFREVDKRRSRQVMTSGGQEPVWDVGYGSHSIFAYYFLQALQENTRRYLTAGSLYEQIKIPVSRNSRQTPIFKCLRDTMDEGGEFIFVLERAFIRK